MTKLLVDMTEPELTDLMQGVGQAVDAAAPGRVFITLLADPHSPDNSAQYVANCEREDAIGWLRETAERLEKREHFLRECGDDAGWEGQYDGG